MVEKIPVLIVGAGPCGLTMAALLQHHHIDFRLIDKRSHIVETSNALAIHARSLEMLDDIGLIDDFIKHGQRIESFALHDHTEILSTIATQQIASHYNYILSLPQYITEKTLNHHLEKHHHAPDRNISLTALRQHNDIVQVTITDHHQNISHIHCRYLIACDGAHSTVRELLNMKFSGNDLPQQFLVADVSLNNANKSNQANVYFDAEGPFGVIPYKSGNARVIATLNNDHRDPKQPISLLELRHIAEKRTSNQVHIADIQWASTFQIHNRILDQFRLKNVFFVGDSAHVHSPAGGQGMNTGMQDAYNLAWKLAMAINGKGSEKILHSYHEERQPIALKLLSSTERLTHFILLKTPLMHWIRHTFVKWILNNKWLQKKLLMFISMLGLHYRHSSIIDTRQRISAKSPQPGYRLPDIAFTHHEKPCRINDILRTEKHSLLIFTGTHLSQNHLHQIEQIQTWCNHQTNFIKLTLIALPHCTKQLTGEYIDDSQQQLHTAYHIVNASFIMVRPDNYIGCCSDQLHLELLQQYWKNLTDT